MGRVRTELGYVRFFNNQTYQGQVTVNGRHLMFDATCFDSGRPPRGPRKGEEVEVLFAENSEEVLLVRVPR